MTTGLRGLSKVSGSPRPSIGAPRADRDTPIEVIEDRPGVIGRLACLGARLTIRPALAIGSRMPSLPWPFGIVDLASRALMPVPGTVREMVTLQNCTAQLVRANGVLPADGRRGVVLYMPGGAFLTCGAHSHSRLATLISKYGDSPVLVLNYRKMPKHTVGQAIEDCHHGWRWLRRLGYRPNHIVLAGDSAGGYLALALAERLLGEGEQPAALVSMSPLMQLKVTPRQTHPNTRTDAAFPPNAFEALITLIAKTAARRIVAGEPERPYEPLDHIVPGLPPTLIHVSGSEVLLYDARLAARRLESAGVPAQVRVWPGQIHDFQLLAPLVPEATRSLRQLGEFIRCSTNS